MSMTEYLSRYPAASKAFNGLPRNYQNWLTQFVSPSVLLCWYVEVEADNAALRKKYGDMMDTDRKEYYTMRYAVDKFTGSTPSAPFFRTNPGDKFKKDASSAEDQFIIDLMVLSYPLLRGFQSFIPDGQAHIRSKYTPQQLMSAFVKGVNEYENGRITGPGVYPNINAAQLARGLWIEYSDAIAPL